MSALEIVRIDVRPFDVELIAPFGVATGAQDVARNVLVTVALSDGSIGHGEAAPFPAINGETQEHAVSAVLHAREVLLGADAAAFRGLALRLRGRTEPSSSARCALETALLDALLRSKRISMLDYFGGVQDHVTTDMTITTGSVKEAEKAAQDILGRGIRAIKLKIGSPDLDYEVERIARVRKIAPDSPLIVDGNCGYDARAALKLLEDLERRKLAIQLFEQPTPKHDLEALKKVADNGDVPVAADESVQSAADALTIIRRGAAQVINIKLMKCGIVEAFDIAAIARTSGTRLMIGGMVETRLAMTTSACFAAGLGGFEFVDLDTPMFLKRDPFCGGFEQTGDRLALRSIAAGHGVEPIAAEFAGDPTQPMAVR